MNFKKSDNSSKEKNSEPDSLSADSQIYRYWHIDHLLNVEIEKAERYQFKFTFLAVDYSALINKNKDYEKNKIIFAILKRSLRIIDFIIRGKRDGYVYIILPETDGKGVETVIERIRENLKSSALKKEYGKFLFAYVNYPMDATSKDLIEEYIFSTLSKVNEKNPVLGYSDSFDK